MKTRVQAQHLQIGDIVGSGEKVINIVRKSIKLPSNKVAVTLKKDGHQRTVQWGKYTTIGVERMEKDIKSALLDESSKRYEQEWGAIRKIGLE